MKPSLHITFSTEQVENVMCFLYALSGLHSKQNYERITLDARNFGDWINLFDFPNLHLSSSYDPAASIINIQNSTQTNNKIQSLKNRYSGQLNTQPLSFYLKQDVLNNPPAIAEKYILLAPFEGDENSRWKETYWVALAKMLEDNGYKVIIPINEDAEIINDFLSSFFYKVSTPQQIINICLHATLIISTVNKYAHIGGALKVKTLGLMSQQNPAALFDYTDNYTLLPSVWCTGCNFDTEKGYIESCKKSCWALQTLMPNVVFTKAVSIIKTNSFMPLEKKPKLLALLEFGSSTGFATVGESIIEKFCDRFETLVMAINYQERKKTNHLSLRVIRGNMSGNDYLGLNTLPGIVSEFKPDYVLANNDAYVISNWFKIVEKTCTDTNIKQPKYCAYLPVDGEIFKIDDFAHILSKGNLISYTEYGRHIITNQMKETDGVNFNDVQRISVAPHCVDGGVFHPTNMADARNMLNNSKYICKDYGLQGNVSSTDFIIGWINRNQPRKNLSTAIFAFSKFAQNKPNARLLIRASNQDYGGNFIDMIKHLKLEKQTIVINDVVDDKKMLNAIYNSIDLFLSTSISEGWGLTEHEAAACGKALVLPDNTVRKELWGNCATLVPCSTPILNPAMCSSIGWLPDIDAIQKVLDYYYKHPDILKADAEKCKIRASTFGTWEQTADLVYDRILN